MSELGENVYNEVMNKWYVTTLNENGRLSIGDAVHKTIELMTEAYENQFGDKIDERVDEIAMQRAKDINGIPVRTLIAKDILTTLISQHLVAEANNEDVAETAVDLTDALLNKLKR